MSLSNYTIQELHLSKSPISDRVYAGFLSSDKKSFNKKKDVTAEFMKVLIDKQCGYVETFNLDGKVYRITVKEIEEVEEG